MDIQTEKNEKKQVAFISYVDQATGRVLAQDRVEGPSGTVIDYQTDKQLQALTAKGYTLAYNAFPVGIKYDGDNQMNQVFVVVLKHDQVVLDPNDRHSEGSLIDPHDPDGMKWPAPETYMKSYVFKVLFVDQDNRQLRPSYVQTSIWMRRVVLDKVTGKPEAESGPWKPNVAHYQDVSVPVIKGYFADQSQITGQPAKQENINKKVVYHPLGKIIPVLADRKTAVPGSKPVHYVNDPNDPTKAAKVQKVPQIAGFTSDRETVTPTAFADDTLVVYKPETQYAVFNYIDADSGQKLVSERVNGRAAAIIDYDPTFEIHKLKEQGYQLVSDSFAPGTKFSYGATREFDIKLKKEEQADKAPADSAAAAQKTSTAAGAEKSYTFTTHFIDLSGKKVFEDDVQSSHWTPNQNGGAAIWLADKSKYRDVKVPVLDGYCANQKVVSGQIAVRFDLDHTVIYRRLGKIIPVDNDGNILPGVDHPYYRNDPHDPTRILASQPAPIVNGYKPELTLVTPDNPFDDTEIVYNKR